MFDMYPPVCRRCRGSGFYSPDGGATSISCPLCGPVVRVRTSSGSSAGIPIEIKRAKPKKGHFRQKFGEAGKKHWQR
jgi:hypothetical protein